AAALMAILAAVAVVAVARIAGDLAHLPRIAVGVAVAAMVAGLMVWNVNHYFFTTGQAALYGDGNTFTATELAYYLRALPPGQTVYFLGPPRMSYYGFQTLPFIARSANGVDVERPLSPGSQPPPVSGPTVFVALPERAPELGVVQGWFPNGEMKEIRAE